MEEMERVVHDDKGTSAGSVLPPEHRMSRGL